MPELKQLPPGYEPATLSSQAGGTSSHARPSISYHGLSSSQPRMDYMDTGLNTGYYHDDQGASGSSVQYQQQYDHDYADAYVPDEMTGGGGGGGGEDVIVGDHVWDAMNLPHGAKL